MNTQRPVIELFQREANSFWTYHAFTPGEEMTLASLNVRFPVIEVYRKVKFLDSHREKDS